MTIYYTEEGINLYKKIKIPDNISTEQFWNEIEKRFYEEKEFEINEHENNLLHSCINKGKNVHIDEVCFINSLNLFQYIYTIPDVWFEGDNIGFFSYGKTETEARKNAYNLLKKLKGN